MDCCWKNIWAALAVRTYYRKIHLSAAEIVGNLAGNVTAYAVGTEIPENEERSALD